MSDTPLTEKVGGVETWAIGNLECAFADGEITSGKAYTSVVPRKCMAYVGEAGFRALSLANNHANDAGNFDETYAALQAANAGVQFFGTVLWRAHFRQVTENGIMPSAHGRALCF